MASTAELRRTVLAVDALALCALHHALFDLRVLGVATDLSVRVSPLYVARSPVGLAVDTLAGQPIAPPRPDAGPREAHLDWHARQCSKRLSS